MRDATATVTAQGVLTNDYDDDNQPVSNAGLTINPTPVVPPAEAAAGGFTLNADGSFSYTGALELR